MEKTMYEKYRDNELPAKVMERIRNRTELGKTQGEKDFIAGFWTHLNIDKCLATPREKRVYISGKITGLPERKYKKLFSNAEALLLSKGYDVINPAALDEAEDTTDWAWEDYMRRDIKLLCGCDYIYLLPNWRDSQGARLEYMVADMLRIPRLDTEKL